MKIEDQLKLYVPYKSDYYRCDANGYTPDYKHIKNGIHLPYSTLPNKR